MNPVIQHDSEERTRKVCQLTELSFDLWQVWTPPPTQRLAQIKQIHTGLFNLIVRYDEVRSVLAQLNLVKSIVAIVFEQ